MSRARLSRATWLLIAGESVSAVGTGLVLPLTLIYLHQVRGIALPEVGALMAAIGAVGLIAVPLTGIALDRFGARPVLFAVLSGQALAEGGLAWVHNAATALPVVLLLGTYLISTEPGDHGLTPMSLAAVQQDDSAADVTPAMDVTLPGPNTLQQQRDAVLVNLASYQE